MSHPPFITQLESSLDFCSEGSLSPSTRFRELPEWDSLANLITLAVFDEVFGKQISADDLGTCDTLQDIINLAV
jgi:acyl carrier protein